MAQRHKPGIQHADTLDGLESALETGLAESESDDVRYQLRTALQKVEVLRVHHSDHER